MAAVHTEALRRIGVEVVGMVGSSPRRAFDLAGPLLPSPMSSIDELLASPGLDAIHVTSPNHVHAAHARAALEAGVAVVCEKPLGVDTAETAELVDLAASAGVVNAVCFNLRYYPQNQNAAALVAGGSIGTPRFVSGHYLQDWLLLDTDWNWRLDAARQGDLRAVADIGSHWIDLTSFVAGQLVTEVFADLHTFITERHRPTGEVQTFAATGVAPDVPRQRQTMSSDDAAGLLLRFDGGARGVCSVSQVSAGRKNRVQWEIDGASSALSWLSEDPERLWVGHRGRANEIIEKDAATLTTAGAAAALFPGGHVEGYPDTFRALFADVYADIEGGAPSSTPSYPTFVTGHYVVAVCEAIAASARTGAWVPVAATTLGAPDHPSPSAHRTSTQGSTP